MNAKAARTVAEELVDEVEYELKSMRQDWWVFLLLGFLLIVCGATAIAFPLMAAVTANVVMIIIGAVMIVGGVATIIGAFWAGRWSGFFLQLLVGLFYTVVGFAVVDAPVETSIIFTVMIAAFFVVIGIFRIIVALAERFPQWGWALLSGMLTTLAGVIIFKAVKAEPATGLWIVGLLVAIELVFNGWYWAMLGLTLRNLPDEPA